MNRVFILGAKRTGISPRSGALKQIPFYDLAAQAIHGLMTDFSGLLPSTLLACHCSGLIAGNALGAGGNPARLMALASGLPISTPAMTVDTQCCSGLDAIGVAFRGLRAEPLGSTGPVSTGLVIAGGAESASLAPIRQDRPSGKVYEEASFTPWPDRNPSMVQAALDLEARRRVSLPDMVDWAIRSHRLGLSQTAPSRLGSDPHPRELTLELCHRGAGVKPYNSTLMAPLADAAAFVVMAPSADPYTPPIRSKKCLEVLDYAQIGSDPVCPGLSTAALEPWLHRLETKFGFDRQTLVVSLMESFAAQVIVNIQDLGLNRELVNPWGGLLARGHPIGASGAVLVCDLFDQLAPGQFGLAAVPAAGGLASGLLVRCVN